MLSTIRQCSGLKETEMIWGKAKNWCLKLSETSKKKTLHRNFVSTYFRTPNRFNLLWSMAIKIRPKLMIFSFMPIWRLNTNAFARTCSSLQNTSRWVIFPTLKNTTCWSTQSMNAKFHIRKFKNTSLRLMRRSSQRWSKKFEKIIKTCDWKRQFN